jgi:hypothetical protein
MKLANIAHSLRYRMSIISALSLCLMLSFTNAHPTFIIASANRSGSNNNDDDNDDRNNINQNCIIITILKGRLQKDVAQ